MTDKSNPLRDILGNVTVSDAMAMAADVLFGKEKEPKASEDPVASHEALFLPKELPRRFVLWRAKDHSGVSGTGYVASGVEFPDKTVAVRWFGNDPSTSLWENIDKLRAVHGHNGSTTVEWLDR